MEVLKLNTGQIESAPDVDRIESTSDSSASETREVTSAEPLTAGNYTATGTGLQEVFGDLNSDWRTRKIASTKLSGVYLELDRMLDSGRLSNGVAPGKRATRVYACSSYLEFAGPSIGDLHLAHANFCRDRLCPQCNKRRSLKIFGQTSAIMDYLQVEHPEYQYIFLTLTLQNCPSSELADAIDTIQDGWRWLYHDSGYFRRNNKSDPEPFFVGSFRSLEVKLAQDGVLWHPHLHVIVAVKPEYFRSPRYLTTFMLVRLWRRACRLDYDPICYIEACSARVDRDGGVSFRSAVCELSKYVVKSNDYITPDLDLSVSRVLPLLLSLHRRRLCSYTGCFLQARKVLALDDPITGDLVDVDPTQLRPDVAEVVCKFQWRCGVYVLTEVSGFVNEGEA